MPREIALQLYTVRNDLLKDPAQTLERVKALGIDKVEIAPLPPELPAQQLARLLRELDLKTTAIHCDLPIGDRANAAVDLAGHYDCRRIIWHGWPRDDAYDRPGGLSDLLDRYNEANANASKHGLQLGLHNHWWEFEPIGGALPLYEMTHKLDPEIFLELDVYWVKTAGTDPLTAMRTLKNRIRMLHLKDGPARQGEPMTALGDGVVDIKRILQAPDARFDAVVIELDECAGDLWQAVERSFEYLRSVE